jgi:hypothetical protein
VKNSTRLTLAVPLRSLEALPVTAGSFLKTGFKPWKNSRIAKVGA